MENAADALKMAAAVLIFVMALSISINAFSEVRQTSQTILDYKDREYDYTYVDDNGGTTTRIVSAETIVPSIYKAYKENYKIVFKDSDGTGYKLYTKKVNNNDIDIFCIDLEKEVLGDDTNKEEFIRALLYGKEYQGWSDIEKKFKDRGITLQDDGLYDKIKGKNFKEELGVYYQEEIEATSNSDTSNSEPDANKTKKRVVTYTMQ